MSALQDKLNGLSAIINEKDLDFEPKKLFGSAKSHRSTSRTSRRSSQDIVAAEREIQNLERRIATSPARKSDLSFTLVKTPSRLSNRSRSGTPRGFERKNTELDEERMRGL